MCYSNSESKRITALSSIQSKYKEKCSDGAKRKKTFKVKE